MAFRVPFKVLHFSSDRLIIFRKHILKSLREHLVNVDGENFGNPENICWRCVQVLSCVYAVQSVYLFK